MSLYIDNKLQNPLDNGNDNDNDDDEEGVNMFVAKHLHVTVKRDDISFRMLLYRTLTPFHLAIY